MYGRYQALIGLCYTSAMNNHDPAGGCGLLLIIGMTLLIAAILLYFLA